jgi:anti-sigma-K factor RskA
MSDSRSDDAPPEDWLLAAEFALGLVDGADQLAIERRLRADRAFSAQIAAWEIRLAALYGDVGEITPPAGLKARIDAELFESLSLEPARINRSPISAAVTFWRFVALSFAALSIICLAILARPLLSPPSAPHRLIAALAPADAATLAVISIDIAARRLDVRGLAIDPGEGDAELWVIPPGGAPRSLGLLDRSALSTKSIGADLMALIAENAALAISLEPKGGSPIGAPTGPVVALGALRKL